jgi:UDP-glucuronate decarboxylase
LGEIISVSGDGSQTRSFCFIDDLIDGLVALMNTPDAVTGPINIGNPTELSILELAKIVIDMTGSNSRIVHKVLPENDPRHRRPDISCARTVLLWQPRVELKEGLGRTIVYFDTLLREGDTRKQLECESYR